MTDELVLFQHGEGGYHTYRIPALLTIPGGRTLAFCEGRMGSAEDYGKIDVVLRVSDDGCRTFGPMRVIAENGPDTIDNPCPVWDRDTGRIWLFLDTNLAEGSESVINLNKAPRDVGYIYSDDRGETWSPFHNLTDTLKLPGWTWYATGPCHGLQLRNGRLVIPCNHGVFNAEKGETDRYQPHVIVSDDHGQTWRLGGTVEGVCGNETTVEELPDGSVYLNARSMKGRPFRITARSLDGGDTWTDAGEDPALPDPMCQASVLGVPDGKGGKALLFSNNPNRPTVKPGEGRRGLTVKLSEDGGRTWPRCLRIHEGRTAYADLTRTEDGEVAVLYECGENWPYDRIVLKRFGVDEVK